MTYPTTSSRKAPPSAQRQAEALQALVSDRGQSTGDPRNDQRAVTRANLAGQGIIELQAVPLTGAPTAADYNKLVADQRALAALLNSLGADFRWTV